MVLHTDIFIVNLRFSIRFYFINNYGTLSVHVTMYLCFIKYRKVIKCFTFLYRKVGNKIYLGLNRNLVSYWVQRSFGLIWCEVKHFVFKPRPTYLHHNSCLWPESVILVWMFAIFLFFSNCFVGTAKHRAY